MRDFGVAVTRRTGGALIRIRGDLDIVSADRGWLKLESAIQATEGEVHLDLAECDFMDSNGLRVIIRAAKLLRERGRTLVVCRARAGVRRVFQHTALNRSRLLDFRDD